MSIEHSFLICGFPRSRTAWLSEFLTVPGVSICSHEATEHAGCAEEFWANAERFAANCWIYGNSDSANLYGLRSMLALRPMTRVIWINRPMDEVRRSMWNIGMPMNDNTVWHITKLRDLCWEYMDLVIDFDCLVNAYECKQIWEYCLPGVPFDYGRWGMFTSRKIGYSKTNPMPQKSFSKFLGWATREVEELRLEGHAI